MNNKNAITYITISAITVILIVLLIKITGKRYYESEDYTWKTETGTKDGDVLIRGKKIDKIKNDINKLIYAINRSEEDPETFRTPENKEPTDPPKLKLRGIKEQVVNVEVINDEHLTQRMGSTGAEEFLAAATFTLTEYDKIKFVNFNFDGGDHAQPGIYYRETFLNNWKIKK
ncbi:MAG: hypothetical protein HY957_00950 [Nitrospirae bacterium]|nr:hypothetical protein [Nitrospirota bacterium]